MNWKGEVRTAWGNQRPLQIRWKWERDNDWCELYGGQVAKSKWNCAGCNGYITSMHHVVICRMLFKPFNNSRS